MYLRLLLLILLLSGCQTSPQFGMPTAEVTSLLEQYDETDLYTAVSLSQLAFDNAAIKLYLWDKYETDNPKYEEQHNYLEAEYKKRQDYLEKLYKKVVDK